MSLLPCRLAAHNVRLYAVREKILNTETRNAAAIDARKITRKDNTVAGNTRQRVYIDRGKTEAAFTGYLPHNTQIKEKKQTQIINQKEISTVVVISFS